jgi:anti-anti-sigma factor
MEGLPDRARTPPELLHIDVHADRPRRAVVSLRGELDHVSAPRVRRTVAALAADGCDEIVLDLSRLSFMDAGGLKLLYALRDDAVGARCSMVDGSDAVARLLQLIPRPWPLPRAAAEEAPPAG